MRMLIIFAVIGAVAYFTWHTFSSGKGIVASNVDIGGIMANPTGFISDRRKASEKTDVPVPPSVSPSLPPASPALLAHGSSLDIPVPASSVSPPQAPSPAFVPEKPIAITYRFQHRELPAASQLDMLKSNNGLLVLSDPSSSTVTFSGQPELVHMAQALMRDLDLSGGSCGVRTWAVYVDRRAQKGFDLAAAIRAVTAPATGLTVGAGGITLNLDAGDLSAALDVIADGATVEVMQRPHVSLMHGVPSTVESLQEVPLPSVAVSQGISQSSIQYRKVGLQLTVTPYFLGHDSVRLAVKQSNGLIGSTVDLGGGVSAPVIESQTVDTTVQLTVGQSVVLGGVATDRLRTVRGLLRNTTERVSGSLYVILSTYHDVPRAVPVDPLPFPAPVGFPSVPFSGPSAPGTDWIDDQILPSKDWQRDEAKFLRARGAK